MERKVIRPFQITDFIISFDRVFGKNYSYEGESHDFIEMVFCDSGAFEVTRNEKVCLLNEGDLLFHAPMEFHRNRTDDPARVIQLSFRHSGKMPETLHHGVFPLNLEERETFLEIFHLADQYLRDPDTDPSLGQEAAEQLSAFILLLCRTCKVRSRLAQTAGALAYQNIIRSMNEGMYENFSLADLAQQNFLSVSYIKSLFARYAGISPKSYYNRLRLQEAARLLGTGQSVGRVAERMNFSSTNYFSTSFQKQYGMTPTQYKKRGI